MQTTICTKLGFFTISHSDNEIYGVRKIVAPDNFTHFSKLISPLQQVYKIINGDAKKSNISANFGLGTKFQRAVWEVISTIPYGEIATYLDIAYDIGNSLAVRAVANACGKNPVPIIVPCHRVVCSNGKIGGYNLGVDLKRKLLKREGLIFN